MEQDAAPPASAISYRREKFSGCGKGCLGLFFGIFFCAGAAACYATILHPLSNVVSARGWVETPCTITSSQVAEHAGDEGPTYSIEIHFEYTAAGKQFEGDRYRFTNVKSGGKTVKQAIVDQYPVGAQAICFVDPNDPTQAVIHRGLTADMWWGLICVPFLAVGVGGLWWVISGPRPIDAGERRRSDRAALVAGNASTSRAHDADEWESDAPIVLRQKWSPLAKFFGMVFVALFWNGITSVFVSIAVQSFLQGRPQWFLTIFLTPFVLVGLGLLAGAVYSFLAIFNPRPTLTLSRARIPLGESAELSWSLARGAGSIRRVLVKLKGEEKASYRRGTSTYMDAEKFFEETLFDSHDPFDFREARTEVRIPADAMHTFHASNNQVAWSIQFAGEVGYWPDVNLEFQIKVMPHERSES